MNFEARVVTPNLPVAQDAATADATRAFYADFLGLSTTEFDLGWVARLTSPTTGTHVQLVTADATSPADAAISVHCTDVDAAYAQAVARGHEIVHPLTDEAWGVRRFLVRDPSGNVVNLVQHRG